MQRSKVTRRELAGLAMTQYELMDLINGHRALIGATWSMLIGIQFALIGGLAVVRRSIGSIEKIIVTIAYTVFMAANSMAQHDNYEYLHHLTSDYPLPEFTEFANNSLAFWWPQYAIFPLYGVLYIGSILIIFYMNKFRIESNSIK